MKKLLCALISVLMFAGMMTFVPAASASGFSDVESGRWSEPYINYAVNKGFLKGVGAGKFDPEGTTTRAMVVTVLWRIEGEPETSYRSDFKDVPESEWYAVPVIWAKDSGVVLGVSADRFDPDAEITREQLATMLYRYSAHKGYDVSGTADLSVYSDKGKISDWANTALSWAVSVGLVKGVTDRTVEPGGPATREQLATILQRFDETKFAFAFDLRIDGGSFVKTFEPGCTDAYVQAVADEGTGFVAVSFTASNGVTVSVGGESAAASGSYRVELTGSDYGYTGVGVEVFKPDGGAARSFSLMVLKPADRDTLYSLKNRPQFHYTPPYGYMNDPNGLVYNAATGEYHLFYQAYPYSTDAVIKHWGHAVTKDLVTFEEKPTALYPDVDGYAMWSGSGIIDYNNDAGLYDETTPPEARIILVYYMYRDDNVEAGLAYTEDGGQTWIKAKGGATLNLGGSYPLHFDPKVLYVEKLGKWVMATASGTMYTSDDLWNWKYASEDTGGECPDLFELRVEETGETKFVRSYSGTFYRVGDLVEGKSGRVKFEAETGDLTLNGDCLDRAVSGADLASYGWFSGKTGSFYATQHFSDAPDGRIITVSWLIEKGLDTTKTWAGALTVPTELKLHVKDGQYYLTSYPVEELKAGRGDTLYSCEDLSVSPDDENVLSGVRATYADIDGVFAPGEGVSEFGFRLREGDGGFITVKYDVASETLIADYSNSGDERYTGVRSMKLSLPEDGRISLRILLDSIITESFGGDGEAAISSIFSRPEGCDSMSFFTVGGTTVIEKLNIYEMRSIW